MTGLDVYDDYLLFSRRRMMVLLGAGVIGWKGFHGLGRLNTNR